jgi:2-oxo-4-hydroxy-4-carboxy-5-ureidoimidazoline decarboxylase
MDALTLDRLNAMDPTAFAAALGDVFEHSPWVAQAAATCRPFATLAALHEGMVDVVRKAGADRQLALIKAHPDLAGKAARAGELTAASTAEQASAGLDALSETEFAAFQRLNSAYQAKFGFPFIVCARRHTKSSILRQFERRLQNDAAAEREAALAEISRIVALRLDQRVDAPERLTLTGRLSTHVLDTTSGRPAAGVVVELFEISDEDVRRLVARRVTNADGRTDGPLIHGGPLPIGTYELRFSIGEYFARTSENLADPPFLGTVPLRFSVAEPEAHYHVPLLASPWSYSTYRGS